jgi:hypothetical protein
MGLSLGSVRPVVTVCESRVLLPGGFRIDGPAFQDALPGESPSIACRAPHRSFGEFLGKP